MANHTHAPGGVKAVHGMLLFGSGPIYLSHLPMFMVPHDQQLILEVEFTGVGNPSATYVKDRAQSGESVYTWVPKPFVLTDLLKAGAAAPEMQGSMVRGHFERGGTPITGSDVRCIVKKVVHAHQIFAAGPRDTTLRYVVFGSPDAAFAAHLISGPPDFDHVLAVDGMGAQTLPATVVIPGRRNDSEQRLRPGDRVRVSGGGSSAEGTLHAGDEIYLELGDLAE
jgi:hypothetical protein